MTQPKAKSKAKILKKDTEKKSSDNIKVLCAVNGKEYIIKNTSLEKFLKTGLYKEIK